MRSSVLHRLAFGDGHAREFQSVAQATEEAHRLIPGLIDYQFFDRDNLSFVTSSVNINGLSLAAFSAPACRMHIGNRPEPALIWSLNGNVRFRAQQRSLAMQPTASAIFVPMGWPTDVEGDERSTVVARIDPIRLERTAKTMLGLLWDDSQPKVFSDPREVPLRLGEVSFDAVFRNLFVQIDAYDGNATMLGHSGIDDIFYRTLAIAMNPQAFVRQTEARKVPTDIRRLERVCEHVMANLRNRITLTDLERVGHMSRRSLHDAFVRGFGMSPMEWVREQRLLKARAMLIAGKGYISVTEVLFDCGFTKPSHFSFQYVRRFGELPSVTQRTKS